MKKKQYRKIKKSISKLEQSFFSLWVDVINNRDIDKNPSIDRIIPLVNQWSIDKGIKDNATPLDQCRKTIEEVEELREALQAQSEDKEYFINSKGKKVNTSEEIKDALGDILVTIVIGAQLQNLDLSDCFQSAYNVIKSRTGKIQNGMFVKDEDVKLQVDIKPENLNIVYTPSGERLTGSEDLFTFRQRMKTKVEIKDEGQE
jgi:NTP pyrophosphatase (non-canonical NTP hydrolase)